MNFYIVVCNCPRFVSHFFGWIWGFAFWWYWCFWMGLWWISIFSVLIFSAFIFYLDCCFLLLVFGQYARNEAVLAEVMKQGYWHDIISDDDIIAFVRLLFYNYTKLLDCEGWNWPVSWRGSTTLCLQPWRAACPSMWTRTCKSEPSTNTGAYPLSRISWLVMKVKINLCLGGAARHRVCSHVGLHPVLSAHTSKSEAMMNLNEFN